jgi:hypothetical protein
MNGARQNPLAIRVFLVDDHSGKPVAGTMLSLFADSEGGGRHLLTTLQTDGAGYASFKIGQGALAAGSKLRVAQAGARGDALVLSPADLRAGQAHTIRVDGASAKLVKHLGLPSVMAPDVVDLTLSPASIGQVPQLLPTGGLCRQLRPTGMSVRRFRAIQVLANICETQEVRCPERAVRFVRGTLREYEVAWYSAGTSLGELLNTFTLAPCERVTVAVSDWMRRETATLDHSSVVRQHQTLDIDHQRLINETMRGTVDQKSLTTGYASSTGANVGMPMEGMTLNFTGAFGNAIGGSISQTDAVTNSTTALSDRISQVANLVASQRNTVVFQATASERNVYQTRTVRNHNHCHTLTLMYYQVNRSYRVVTDYRGERDVVLVHYENAGFDAQRAWAHAALLQGALLDPALAGGFAAIGEALFCCDVEPPPEELWMDSVTFRFGEGNVHGTIIGTLFTTGGPVQLPPFSADPSVTVTLPYRMDPRTVTAVLLDVIGGHGMMHHSPAFVSSVEVTYHAVGHGQMLGLSIQPARGFLNPLFIPAKAEIPPFDSVENPCLKASCAARTLLGHLSAHKRYYNRLIWMKEDPHERLMRWSCCTPLSLIDEIENEPITTHGDFVVFPAAGSQLVDDPMVLPVETLVTMPTPGVYSEGVLGRCDTCEVVDPQRFWNWKDSPCTDADPPAPTAPTPQSGVRLADLAEFKADTVTNLIELRALPDVPGSGLKELLSILLANADNGSKEAQAMLAKLLETVKASIPQSSAAPVPQTPTK